MRKKFADFISKAKRFILLGKKCSTFDTGVRENGLLIIDEIELLCNTSTF